MSISLSRGRFGNKCFIHLAASLFSEKHNLFIEYQNFQDIKHLGIDLFVGEKKFDKTIQINNNNFFQYYEKDNIDFNVSFSDYFQSKKITDLTHKYIHSKMNKIVSNNKFKSLYNNNNNCFIHIRLGDIAKFNPGFKYYDYVLSTITVDKIFLSTDSEQNEIVQQLKNKYQNLELYHPNCLYDIILFASTHKYIILSHGTFSGIIGYLSFFSKVYFIKETQKTSWETSWNLNSQFQFDIFKDKYSTTDKFIEIDTDLLPEPNTTL